MEKCTGGSGGGSGGTQKCTEGKAQRTFYKEGHKRRDTKEGTPDSTAIIIRYPLDTL